jgi:hypothetical protein
MTRVLHRLSRSACPAADRPWVDALFAELETIETGRGRLLWLLGATHLVFDRYVAALLSPVNLLLLAAAVLFAWMAVTEYEGLAAEDDWYGPIAAIFVAGLIGVSVFNLRRSTRSLRP